jgi:hypothetical protein
VLRISSNRINDNIHSSQRLLESLAFIVHNSSSTQTSDVVQIGGGDGRDYMKASLAGQLSAYAPTLPAAPWMSTVCPAVTRA